MAGSPVTTSASCLVGKAGVSNGVRRSPESAGPDDTQACHLAGLVASDA